MKKEKVKEEREREHKLSKTENIWMGKDLEVKNEGNEREDNSKQTRERTEKEKNTEKKRVKEKGKRE